MTTTQRSTTTETTDEAREQILRGLSVTRYGGLALVQDGYCAWLARADELDAGVAAQAGARAERLARLAARDRLDEDDVHDYSELCQRVTALAGAGGASLSELVEELAGLDESALGRRGLAPEERDALLGGVLGSHPRLDLRTWEARWEAAGSGAASDAEDAGRALEAGEEPAGDVLAGLPAVDALRDRARSAWQRGWDDYADAVACAAEE